MFKQLPEKLNYPEIEKEILKFGSVITTFVGDVFAGLPTENIDLHLNADEFANNASGTTWQTYDFKNIYEY